MMKEVSIANLTIPLAEPLYAGYCQAFLCKLRGLSWRRSLPHTWGLLLVQDKQNRMDASIHMFGMWFDLAIVWINDAMQVVDVRLARKWRSMILPRQPARYVLEIGAARLDDFHIGDCVRFEEVLDH